MKVKSFYSYVGNADSGSTRAAGNGGGTADGGAPQEISCQRMYQMNWKTFVFQKNLYIHTWYCCLTKLLEILVKDFT